MVDQHAKWLEKCKTEVKWRASIPSLNPAGVTGFIGFAVGRTTWLEAVTKWRAYAIGREIAAAHIAKRFREWTAIFEHVSVH